MVSIFRSCSARLVGSNESKPLRILLCDIDQGNGCRSGLREILECAPGLSLRLCEIVEGLGMDLEQLAGRVRAANPDIVFLGLRARQPAQLVPLFQALRTNFDRCPLIAVTDGLDAAELYDLLRLGASDFLTLPLRSSDVLSRLTRLIDETWRGDALIQELKEKLGLKQIVGESPALLREIQKIPQMARCDATVLISGETGTGKEICARAVHYLSLRAGQPFIAVNCGAIPTELVENELFGHEPGAFTSASASQTGVVQEAEAGTLFLDEVDKLTPVAQVKLLRFLQEREYRPLGARKSRRADVRVIAASNTIFEETLRAGHFRHDLYYRLNVLPITLPALRERQEDIPLLARHFAKKYAAEFNRTEPEIGCSAIQKLGAYPWPGNIRELENVVQRAILLCETDVISAQDILLPGASHQPVAKSFQALKAGAVAQFERSYLQALLLAHQGNINAAARAAQKNRRAFWELLRKHQMLSRQDCLTP